jgi:hypothetical protein
MERLFVGVIIILFNVMPRSAVAVTIRYALIIGNNEGTDPDGAQPFTPLLHAEREATILKKKLVKLSNFDSSGNRTRLLIGATRADVKAAVAHLVMQRQADQEAFGKIDTLFFFYFTGHGLSGRLLLEDGALQADEIGNMFTQLGADFSIGIFDTCFAGSLDMNVLAAKGIHSAPGLNLFRELPEEVLSAEGSIWYVSSGSNQESFEDARLGGVFTHFFIEALEKAEASGPGITLENIWQYARANTVEYTAQRKRIQVPEQYIANLRSNAPIYFSFLKPRSATLVLSTELEGRFALAYKAGNLTEVFEKKSGIERVLAVYPGRARLVLVDKTDSVSTRTITLQPREKLVLSAMPDNKPTIFLGERSETLFEKGIALDTYIAANRVKPSLSALVGLGYNYNVTHSHLLFARHGFLVPFRFDRGHLFFGVQAEYGYDKREFPAWTHRVHALGGKILGGYAINVSTLRLGIGAAFDYNFVIQEYENHERRMGGQYRPLLEINGLYSFTERIHGAFYADVGGIYSPGIGADSGNIWQVSATFGGLFYFRVY